MPFRPGRFGKPSYSGSLRRTSVRHRHLPGDWDVFRLRQAEPASRVVAEVYARRLDSPVDSVLELTDAAGERLAFNDDHEDRGRLRSTRTTPIRWDQLHAARRRLRRRASGGCPSTGAARSMPIACGSVRRGPI